ncbi:HugZ family protein [Pseudoruegeria sp. SK021]|uniref:HugZ family pyridoxamine 5'-phosphate oxidase n=1 Tax=Pseudoruegeria sp. SK021 TaxID=1933035 RepID=UPI000A21CB78|nr:HugZ family protein [Pseudoruegeria sp. SK021]OSP55683.1 pyridoxamine 5-phosphate oxidase [Pseudoruegeria sp. SK021]
MSSPSVIRPTDDDARALAQRLIGTARSGALAVLDPTSGVPQVTRVAMGTTPEGQPLTLISELSAHTVALRADLRCSLLLGEPGPRGDPLTHPRLTLTCTACFVPRDDPAHIRLRAHYLGTHPKAQLYIDFSDFSFLQFRVHSAALNGGFGKAFHLGPGDLGLT